MADSSTAKYKRFTIDSWKSFATHLKVLVESVVSKHIFIDGVEISDSDSVIHYGEATLDSSNVYNVTLPNFKLQKGSRLIIRFMNDFPQNDDYVAQLRVNDSNTLIIYNGRPIRNYHLRMNKFIEVVSDGSLCYVVGELNESTAAVGDIILKVADSNHTFDDEGLYLCDGKEYYIDDLPLLSQFFKDEFGRSNVYGGDGSTTFAVPNLNQGKSNTDPKYVIRGK